MRALDERETTVTVLQQTVGALDTWKHWATGYNVSSDQLADSVDILHRNDRADHTALAAPLATWVDRHGFTPRLPSIERDVPRIEPLGLDIGL